MHQATLAMFHSLHQVSQALSIRHTVNPATIEPSTSREAMEVNRPEAMGINETLCKGNMRVGIQHFEIFEKTLAMQQSKDLFCFIRPDKVAAIFGTKDTPRRHSSSLSSLPYEYICSTCTC